MVIHGLLIPLLRHLQKIVFREEGTDDTGVACGNLLEVVNQTKLLFFIAARADNVLHDLNQHAGGIELKGRLSAVKHFFMKCFKRGQSLIHSFDAVQSLQKVNDRHCHANFMGGDHILDTVGMQTGIKGLLLFGCRGAVVNHLVDASEQFSVFFIEVKSFSHV